MKKNIPLFLAAFAFVCCSSNGAGAPETARGPKSIPNDRIAFNSDRAGNNELFIMNADGSDIVQLTNDAAYECWWPKISPDRTKVLFYRAPKGSHEDYAKTSLWVYDVSSKEASQLRAAHEDGWIMQGHAEWSPDGSRIAMFGGTGPYLEIFVTDGKGKNPVQYTDRGGYNTDVSWSPDGKKLAFNGYPGTDYARDKYEIYVMDAIPLALPTRITDDGFADYDPYFSPDGKKIAWLRNADPTKGFIEGVGYLGDWAICVADADGGKAEYLIRDGNINSKPEWNRDGSAIFFHRMEYDPLVEYKFGVFALDVATRKIRRLTATGTGANEYPDS